MTDTNEVRDRCGKAIRDVLVREGVVPDWRGWGRTWEDADEDVRETYRSIGDVVRRIVLAEEHEPQAGGLGMSREEFLRRYNDALAKARTDGVAEEHEKCVVDVEAEEEPMFEAMPPELSLREAQSMVAAIRVTKRNIVARIRARVDRVVTDPHDGETMTSTEKS